MTTNGRTISPELRWVGPLSVPSTCSPANLGHLMDIAVWLRGLGLERYELAFRDNEIDWETLPKVTAQDLKDLGVVLGGHRRKLLAAIAALQGGAAPSMQRPSVAERRQLTVMFCDLVGS